MACPTWPQRLPSAPSRQRGARVPSAGAGCAASTPARMGHPGGLVTHTSNGGLFGEASLCPPRCDPPRELGSAAGEEGRCRQLPAPAGRDPHSLPRQPLAAAPAPNLLFLIQTLPLLRRYQGSASPPAARHKQPRVLRGPHPPRADITLPQRRADTPGAAGSGSGFPGPRHHDQRHNTTSCHAAPASRSSTAGGPGAPQPTVGLPGGW